ncbi:universal stress protein [Nodosilinea sp. LEGE 06152]|uniref:universal stress protein n=1 Tax=Nodosilinea sp. LEGE 06152 TaxID=2777966 RepID=UPI0018818237|nr:universal stress protein [Nodosilinea sp. LEGE 06152]MBE9159622.1 universal stress protein [Nodosilinea sp. LEGE 06152]
MFKKILVALDNSTHRQAVFEKALDLASATGADLMLCHVLSAYEEGSPGIPIRSYQAYYPVLEDSTWRLYQKRWEEFEAQGIAQLRQELETARTAGVSAEFTQVAGEPAATICSVANSWQADLIMVGSHGRRGISELLLGSVSNYVMHHAECSVLVVHGTLSTAATSASTASSAKATYR